MSSEVLSVPEQSSEALHAELTTDPGWWRVQWPSTWGDKRPIAVTFFRERDEAIELQHRLRGVAAYVEWVPVLP